MLVLILTLIFAVIVLTYGADLSLETSEKIGNAIGLSPLVIGIVLVGLGTSLPEFFVSQLAVLDGKGSIAIGNVLGSNIANILLILGVSSFFVNLSLKGRDLFVQFIYHLILTVSLFFILQGERFSIFGSIYLFFFFGLFLHRLFIDMKRSLKSHPDIAEKVIEDRKEQIKHPEGMGQVEMAVSILKLIIGFGMLYAGGELLVYSGTGLGKELGVSEFVISAILLAFGTSFPELVTCILACIKKKDTEVIIGNILGSNIFNIAFVLGSVGFYQFPFEGSYQVEIALLSFLGLIFIAFNKFNMKLNKKAGVFFFLTYGAMVVHWV